MAKRSPGAGARRAIAAVIVILLVGGSGYSLARSQASARRDLVERFHLRAELGGRFVASFVRELGQREVAQAESLLAADVLDPRAVGNVTRAFGFEASVVLDARGRYLAGSPHDPALVGADLTPRYEHLRTAVRERRFAISGVVPSAVRGIPVVGFAAPYDTPHGPRVFSGAYDISETPLSTHLDTMLPIEGGRVFIVERAGTILAANGGPPAGVVALARAAPVLAERVETAPQGRYTGDVERFYTAVEIAGTPWRLVATVPIATQLAPLSGARTWLPWVLYAAFALLAGIVALLVLRVFEDRHELGAVNAELRAKNEEVERYARAQRDFVAIASHELRSPLAAISGSVYLLGRRDLPEDQRKLVDLTRRSTARLGTLVDELLLLHEAQAGVIRVYPAPMDPGELVRAVAEEFAPVAAQHEIHLDVVVEDDTPPAVADRSRMEQVLWNLLSNAAKFTPPGGRIRLTAGRADDGGPRVSVADTGPGIAGDELERVFDTFFRSRSEEKNRVTGTGLGLAIVKSLVDAQEGRVTVHSDEGEGAEFHVSLPAAPPAAVDVDSGAPGDPGYRRRASSG